MIARHIKLKLNAKHLKALDKHLWHLTGVYNWAIKTVELRRELGLPYSEFDLYKLVIGHSERIGISDIAIKGTIHQAYKAWARCFRKQSKNPRLKSVRNRLSSILFRNDCKLFAKFLKVPRLGKFRFHAFSLPTSKQARQVTLIKKASGWYAVLLFEPATEKIKSIDKCVGIDTGFKHLAILSNGEKIDHPRELEKSLSQLAKNQRGLRKKKTARLHEKIKNKRKDRNHKISRNLVNRFGDIFITNDNLNGMSKKFGKSVGSSGINQLRQFILYKSRLDGKKCVLVDSRKTTMSCSNCGSLTGPTGLKNLNVRNWVCAKCGIAHDRDINAAINVLNFGRRYRLESLETVAT